MRPDAKRTERALWWDRAWSLVQGCTPASEACDHCWSARQSHMWRKNPNEKIAMRHSGLTEEIRRAGDYHDDVRFNGNVRCMESFLDRPRTVKKGQVWSVWNDLFHADVPTKFILQAMAVMRECPQHLFLVLTKRIETAGDIQAEFGCIPPNMWLGTTVESQDYMGRAKVLSGIDGVSRRFLSMEPLIGPVVFEHNGTDLLRCPKCGYTKFDMNSQGDHWRCKGPGPRIDWIIVGGESGTNARPMHPEWVKSISEQCERTDTPLWFKQWGEWLPIRPFEPGDEYGNNETVLNDDGQDVRGYHALMDIEFRTHLMRRVGKKKAGRLLNGQENLEWMDYEEDSGGD